MRKMHQSLWHAINGVCFALRTERNMRVHLLAFAGAMMACWLLQISRLEWLLVICMSALTFSLELANTAIERLADRITLDQDAVIGVVKDVMAGAVLVASFFSLVTGFVIFYGPITRLF